MASDLYLLRADTYSLGLFCSDQAAKDHAKGSVHSSEWEDCGAGNWVARDYWRIERVKVYD